MTAPDEHGRPLHRNRRGRRGACCASSGDLTLPRLGVLPDRLERAQGRAASSIDLSERRPDGHGRRLAGPPHRARPRRRDRRRSTEDHAILLDQVASADQPVKVRPEPPPPFARVLGRDRHRDRSRPGRTLRRPARLLRRDADLDRRTSSAIRAASGSTPSSSASRWSASTRFGIIGLMSFLVGIVIAQQGAVQLRQFGAEVFTINLIGRSSIKELGVLMTAIMVAGRSGSAFAAQLGSMKLDRGNRRDAHDRRLADGGPGLPARARDGADDAAARLLRGDRSRSSAAASSAGSRSTSRRSPSSSGCARWCR